MKPVFKFTIKFFLSVLFFMFLVQGNQIDGYSAYVFSIDSIYGNAKDSLIVPGDSLLAIQENLTHGKSLYEKNCGKCHELHSPSEYTLKEWKENLNEMKDKAEINKKEYKLILGYLSANCKK